MTWTDWPATRAPGRALLATALILTTVAIVLPIDGWLAIIGALLLVRATAEVLLPARYTLDADGVRIARPLSGQVLGWSQLTGWSPISDGYQLVGTGRHPLVRHRRSARLHCPAHHDDVGALLQRHLG